jgi:hypothetical protein
MTTYSIAAPDGKTYEIEGPAGASQEDVQNEVMRQNPHLAGSRQPTESSAVAVRPAESAQAAQKASAMDIVAGLPATRIIAGAAAPLVGALQAGANIGDWLSKKLGQDPVLGKFIAEQVASYEAAKKRGMTALGNNGPDIAGFAGSAATGAAALKNVVPAAGYLGRVAQGTAVGAGAGATTPTTTPGIEQTLMQAGSGAALGGGIPAVSPIITKGGQAAYRTFVEPLTNRTAIKGRAYIEATGDKTQKIINALRANQELVPGSLPTAGEAASSVGRAEFSALQGSAEKVLPSNYLARADQNKAARVNQLSSISGTEAQREALKQTRGATYKRNLSAAEAQGIDQQMADAIRPQLDSLMSRPSMERARARAVELAREKDIALTDFGSVEGLNWVKKGLDDEISSAAKLTSAAGKEQLVALRQTKDDLLATLDQIAPGLSTARQTFAAQSKPINQAEVAQYLKDKLTPALDETAGQRAASFAGAVRDAPGTIKRSLDGAPRYQKLSDVLEPDQVAKVEAIRKDLARVARQEMMAQKGTQAGPNAMDVASQSISGATGGGRIPNPLSRVVTVANAIIGRLEGKIDKKLAIEIAAEMLSPAKVSRILQKETIKATRKAALVKVVNNLRLPATALATQNALSSKD